MKHQKEWHTCDRCGVEIEYNYSAVANIEVEKQSYRLGICGVIYKKKRKEKAIVLIYALSAGEILRGL